jgi:hypothetical protein
LVQFTDVLFSPVDLENGLIRRVGERLTKNKASHPRRQYSSEVRQVGYRTAEEKMINRKNEERDEKNEERG